MIKALQPCSPGINQHFKVPIDYRATRAIGARVAVIQLIALTGHGRGDIGQFTGIVQPMPALVVELLVEFQALLLKRFEAFSSGVPVSSPMTSAKVRPGCQ